MLPQPPDAHQPLAQHLPIVTYDTTAARVVVPGQLVAHLDGPFRVICTCYGWGGRGQTQPAAVAAHALHAARELVA
jgi:hypothetical protein